MTDRSNPVKPVNAQQADKPNAQSPAEIARETFRQLGLRRMAPTPQAYREIYEEIAGTSSESAAPVMLAAFAENLMLSSALSATGKQLQQAAKAEDWDEYGRQLVLLSEKTAQAIGNTAASTLTTGSTAQLASAAKGGGIEIAGIEVAEAPKAKSAGMALVDPASTANASTGSIGTTAAAPAAPPASDSKRILMADAQTDSLRDMLSRTLNFAVVSLLQNDVKLKTETEQLADAVKEAKNIAKLDEVAGRLKKLYYKIEVKSTDLNEQQTLLLKLFKLLLENIGELLEDDSWLRGQIDNVQNVLGGPMSHASLHDATRSMKEVIYKQSMLKHSLAEAKLTVKNMMITFIDRLSEVATSTGDYHAKMSVHSQKITQTTDMRMLNQILSDVMNDTRSAQLEALRSRDDMLAARQQVQEAEERIHQLQAELEQMSELVREDQLTGSLNRRGLDDVFEREVARAERTKTPFCVALLDLDDFKRINDSYGHQAGDEALIHLVRVIKDTLRTMDVIGRFGGEEFMLLLPDTAIPAAMQTVTRVQRELTKRIFMHRQERVLITFSAGVALRQADESQEDLFKRVDDALYKAKRAGKNRVIAAE